MGTKKMNPKKLDDPWESIDADMTKLLGRRVQGNHVLSIFWIKSSDGAPGILIKDVESEAVPVRIPRARGISIQASEVEGDFREVRIILLAPEDRSVFLALCNDIIAYTRGESSLRLASLAVFRRLDHWQALLSRGQAGGMGPNEVRGLIGELCILQALADSVGIAMALRYWVAPDDHPQDFAMDASILEVKTRLAGSRQQVQISSLEQLESGDVPLCLITVELAPSAGLDAFSLNDVAGSILQQASLDSVITRDVAERRLLQRGYLQGDEYGVDRYVVSGMRAYGVEADFPRIVRSRTDLRIKQASYVIDIASMSVFERDFGEALGTERRG
jgi:hypothetical protein